MSAQNANVAALRICREIGQEAGLADARGSIKHHAAARSAEQGFDLASQFTQFSLAAEGLAGAISMTMGMNLKRMIGDDRFRTPLDSPRRQSHHFRPSSDGARWRRRKRPRHRKDRSDAPPY